ncbi:hypothetical protein ACP70R_009108 [Stipagrostis hirtigluma subsp. patula]
MSGGVVPGLACRKRLRSCHSAKNKMAQKSDDDEKERKKMQNDDGKVKNRKESAASFENEKKRNLSDNRSKVKWRSDSHEQMFNCGNKVKNLKVPSTLYEKKKKKGRMNNANGDNKMCESVEGEAGKKKMVISESVEKKVNGKKGNKLQKNNSNKRSAPVTSVVKEKRKREEQPTLFNKKKKMLADDDGKKKVHSGNLEKEKICCYDKEKKSAAPFSFFKVICSSFEEFLILPPMVASRLQNLTNHHVYLQDLGGKCSEVRLSVVGGSLAFHQGWNSFVSDHLIKWGDLLLFECIATAKATFSVRVFGRDSCERLTFNVEGKRKCVREKQTRINRSPEDLVSFDGNPEDKNDEHSLSGEYDRSKELETQNKTLKDHVTLDTKEDPNTVGCGLGPSVALDKKDGNLINGQCKTKGISPLRSKKRTVITIFDSDSGSSVQKNEDTVKLNLTTSSADSDTHHVTVNTNEHHRKVQSGVGHRTSFLQDDKGRLPSRKCGTKCISPTCSNEQTRILITDAATSKQENNRVKLTTCTHHNEDKHMIIESVSEAAALTKCAELHNLDKDVRGKQEINYVPLESITTVDKYQNNSKTNLNENTCRKYEAPVGFRCLEKWRKGIVRGNAALDGAGLMKQTSGNKLVGTYGATRPNPVKKCLSSEGTCAFVQPMFNVPFQKSSSPDRVSKCEHSGTEIDHTISGQGAVVQLHTKEEQSGPVGGSVSGQSNNNLGRANYVSAGNCGAMGLDVVGSEGTCACVESMLTMPVEKLSSHDKVSKCGSSSPEIDHHVEVKGTVVQVETNMGQVEPVESTVNSQSYNTSERANHVVSCQPGHRFFKQEDCKSTNCVNPVALLPAKADILELDDRSSLKINMQFFIPNTTQKWLELPRSLSSAVRRTRQHQNVIMLKDPVKRLWPVFYYEKPVFVGFTEGWKKFVAANDLEAGDLCELFEEPSEEEPVYSVQITRK